MLKNIMKIISNVICCAAIIVSPYVFAGVEHVFVEIPCSESFIDASWKTFDGEAGSQFTFTTSGIRDIEKGADIVKVANVGVFNHETPYGLGVHVVAVCVPSDNGKYMSSTGTILRCNKGEGLKIEVFAPNGPNRSYVGILTITRDEEEKPDVSMAYDEMDLLQTEIKFVVPEVEPNFKSIIGSFDSF